MIEFIDNQTIKFYPEGNKNCGCIGRRYCQPVNIADETQFQILGEILNSDPEFGDQYVGWDTWTALELSESHSNISAEGECDGTVILTASLGSGSGYLYSFDGSTFSETNEFDNLCPGTYLAVAKDSDGHYASIYVTIGEYFDCSFLNGKFLSEMTGNYLSELNDCYLNNAL